MEPPEPRPPVPERTLPPQTPPTTASVSRTRLLITSLSAAGLTIIIFLLLGQLSQRLPEAYPEQFLKWAGPFEGLPAEGILDAQSLVLLVAACGLGLLSLYGLAKLFSGQKLRLPLRRTTKEDSASLKRNTIFFFVFFIGLNALFSLLDLWRFGGDSPPVAEPSPIGLLGTFLFFFYVAGAGPFFEEALFRGFLYARLRKPFGFWPAFLISGIFFTLLHFDSQETMINNVFDFIDIMIFSYFVTKTFEETGNLWNAVILHGLYNGWLAIILILTGTLDSFGGLG